MAGLLSHKNTFTAGGSVATSTPVSYQRGEAARIINNSGATQTLTVHESDESDGTYVLCDDVGTNGVLAAIADAQSLLLPVGLRGSRWLKFVADNTALPELILVQKG